MPITRWDELYESRLDWAERAYATFLHGIDEEVARDFERKGEVTVVLYGRTQVGKTTLLLKVLGIADEHFAQVSLVLRGGREAGHSATATATRYARSQDDYWRIGPDQDDPHDDEALERHLARLRMRVEAGKYDDDNPVNIWIPRRYFIQQAPRIDVRILDLPGTHSTNPNEQKHVARVAARFVPAADVVLLVGKANALGFLKPEELGLEELQYWPHSPERFKIILTHTYSAQSTKDWIAEKGGCDVHSVRGYMLEQLRTHDPDLTDRLSNSLFPIEFGGSWEALRNTGDAVFTHADPIVSRLMDDLARDVLASATKYARIRSAFNVHAAIKEKRQTDVGKQKARKQKLVAATESQQASLDALEAEVSEQKAVISTIRNNLTTLDRTHARDKAEITSIISSRSGTMSRSAKDVVVIKEFIAESKGNLAAQWEELCDQVSQVGAPAGLGEYPRSLVDGCFNEIMRVLNSYSGPFSDTYLWLDNYLRDCEAAREARKLAVVTLCAHADALLDQLATKEKARLVRLEKKACDQLQALQSNRAIRQERVIAASNKVVDLDEQIRAYIQESKAKELRARRYDSHLRTAFNNELEAQCSNISKASNPVEKFSRLCFTVLLGDEYRKLES